MSTAAARRLVLRCSTIVAVCSTLAACGGGAAEPCVRDSECASGFCKADGTCGPASDVDAPIDPPADGTSALCAPDQNGTISAPEVPLAAGKMATFRVS